MTVTNTIESVITALRKRHDLQYRGYQFALRDPTKPLQSLCTHSYTRTSVLCALPGRYASTEVRELEGENTFEFK